MELSFIEYIQIPDCPREINEDKEYFRNMFRKWIRLFTTNHTSRVIITDRSSGKSKNTALYYFRMSYLRHCQIPFFSLFHISLNLIINFLFVSIH